MAAISLTKNAIFNLSMAFPSFPSPSPRSSRKVSRVCFSYASSYSEDRNNCEGSREVPVTEPGDEDVTYEAKEAVERTKERAQEMKEKAKEKTKEGTYKAAESAKERVKDNAQETKEKREDVAGSVADKAKEGTYPTETMQNIGEKAKQTVKGAWDAAKETAQKIKETVVGKEDVDDEDGGGGRKTMDEDVVELRRRAGNPNKK